MQIGSTARLESEISSIMAYVKDEAKMRPIAAHISKGFDDALARNLDRIDAGSLARVPKEMRDLIITHLAFTFDQSRSERFYNKLVELMENSEDVCMTIAGRIELADIETKGGHTLGNIAVGFSEAAKLRVLGNEHLFLSNLAKMGTVYNRLLRVNFDAITIPRQ